MVIMNIFRKLTGLTLALVSLITLLMVLPALLFGVFLKWQVIVLALSYFCFFLATVWRTIKYGELAQRSQDEQVKSRAGRLASIALVIGILAVHWFAIYDFSQERFLDNYADTALTTVAIFFIISSIIVNQTAVRTLGIFFDRLTIKRSHQLVNTGIYSRVRHPIYLSYILLFIGFCTMMQSIISFVLLAVVCLVWFGNRMAIEEEMLTKEFGNEYKIYQQQTKKLFPFIY